MTNIASQLIKSAMQSHQSGDLQRAKTLYAEILERWPEHPDALHLYGLACHQLGEHGTAVTYIRKAVERVPDQAVLRNNLGDALHKAGQIKDAISHLKKALELRPGYAGAHQNLASIYLGSRQYDLALIHCRQSVELDGSRPQAWFNLGLCLLEHVKLEESAHAFRQALALRPDYQPAVTSLLYVLNLLPDQGPQAICDEHVQVATAAFDSTRVGATIHAINQPIRIGYVSGDFQQHAVNYFFEPVLEHHNAAAFEVYCYSDVDKPDGTTRRLQAIAGQWRDMAGRSDAELLAQILADGIDILVDLAGYTRHNRLPVFARQAAAVQLSWLGFPNTTGLKAMNYRIADCVTEPPHLSAVGSEQLIRMPIGFACFRPPAHAPEVAAAPLINNGHVTLGSLHKLEKMNPSVITLWAQLLMSNPDTRLFIARDNLDDWQQRRIFAEFNQHGVNAERLRLMHLKDSGQSFFDLFAEIDVLLDVFPWSGHTMACSALWMGVPVVTLNGNTHAGRMVASVLKMLDLDELIAADKPAYGQVINRLCRDHEQLLAYRNNLRTRFQNSPLRDETGFTRELEAQYRRILKV